ncbi:hypothetical protein DAI22_06g207700 [Oryza sativa Japonica Group]|nr:hypothetical protein DAI22_06g207700 [Oryza sativa Japonica Group]
MAEWSKAPDSSSGPLTRAWVQIPLLTFCFLLSVFILFSRDSKIFRRFVRHFFISFLP